MGFEDYPLYEIVGTAYVHGIMDEDEEDASEASFVIQDAIFDI